jgi:hypothetical protein
MIHPGRDGTGRANPQRKPTPRGKGGEIIMIMIILVEKKMLLLPENGNKRTILGFFLAFNEANSDK